MRDGTSVLGYGSISDRPHRYQTPAMEPLHKRADDDQRGRHLIATRPIEAGTVVFVEKPMLCLQSIGNAHAGALTCRCCRCFVGGPDLAVAVASGRISREDAFEYWNNELSCGGGGGEESCDLDCHKGIGAQKEEQAFNDNNNGSINESSYNIVPCRNECGEMYCSLKCEEEMWTVGGHCLLCTGLIPEPEVNNDDDELNEDKEAKGSILATDASSLHPLLQFKIHAIQSNEILLMVADLIASVVSTLCKRMELEEQYMGHGWGKNGQLSAENKLPTLKDMMEPYLDFTLVPWWTVATAPLLSTPMGFAEASELDSALRRICRESSALLKEAILSPCSKGSEGDIDKTIKSKHLHRALDECDAQYDMFSEEFFGKIIGSFEQNALGIRARHPLCRCIFDQELRSRRHDDLVRCIEAAGMIGDDGSVAEDKQQEHGDEESLRNGDENEEEEQEGDEEEYTVDEIAEFIARLEIDEESCGLGQGSSKKDADEDGDNDCNEEKDAGDDMDVLFTPMDGTAMYSTTCKMNHSCSPNVVARYRYSSSAIGGGQWGVNHPLSVECVALRDIDEGEELTISYIKSDEPLEKRTEDLANYGFTCNCAKCHAEREGAEILSEDSNEDEGDPFGSDDEDNVNETDDPFGSDDESEAEECNNGAENISCGPGESLLQQRVMQLNNVANESVLGRLSVQISAHASTYIVQTGGNVLEDISEVKSGLDNSIIDCVKEIEKNLKDAVQAVNARDLYTCFAAGIKGEAAGLSLLYRNGSWPCTPLRAAYWCLALSAAIACADSGHFAKAMALLDKAMILGLPSESVKELFEYVEYHSAARPYTKAYLQFGLIYDYRHKIMREHLASDGLSKPIAHPADDVSDISQDCFYKEYVSASAPLVIRAFADSWPAVDKWCNLDYWAYTHGHRVVPIELGDMKRGGMKETIMSFHKFVSSFLLPSTAETCWPLLFAASNSGKAKVAYLAQHQLFEQLPALLNDIAPSPSLCGEAGPTHVNVWVGTGGTRTPLHFDTYDNLFVQIVGCKYVRIYGTSETDKVYVIKKDDTSCSYGMQGNMSSVDCELEDFDAQPEARDAKYVEVLLFPGDCLYIPARAWHYVRSLTTSMSVNFWF